MSCAAAEGVLRGMLVRLDFSADELLTLHLDELEAVLDELARRGARHSSLDDLKAADEALRAACTAFASWRFSTDAEHAHLPLFQRESLRLLDEARSSREAAATQLV
jgi:hypothetical protein